MILDAYIFYFQFLCSLFIGFGLFLGSYHLESELGKQVGEVDVGHPFIIISVFSTGSDQVVVIFQLPDVFGFVACQDGTVLFVGTSVDEDRLLRNVRCGGFVPHDVLRTIERESHCGLAGGYSGAGCLIRRIPIECVVVLVVYGVIVDGS